MMRKMVFIVQVHKFTLTVCCMVECRKRISSTEWASDCLSLIFSSSTIAGMHRRLSSIWWIRFVSTLFSLCVCVCWPRQWSLKLRLHGWWVSVDHITPALRDVLHWLPVPQRTEFKIAVLVFDCVRGTGPAYFKDVCVPVSDIAARSSLRSAERGDLFVPRTRTMKLSRRSFTVAAPVVWNSLPAHLRSPLISRWQFRAGLKTHLF